MDARVQQHTCPERTVTYDVVILDLSLPIKDGLDVCRDLRSKGDVVVVLMLTARDSVEDRIGGLDAGADDYLTKLGLPTPISGGPASARSHSEA
jgi:DNA-binding response OmpR family regulator